MPDKRVATDPLRDWRYKAGRQDGSRERQPEIDRLRGALEEKHRATGFCPLCEAGPPPHHNPGCVLGPEGSDG